MRHLTISDEQFWFRGIMAAEPAVLSLSDEDYDAMWQVGPETSADEVFARYLVGLARPGTSSP
jgi:hypothetical protein